MKAPTLSPEASRDIGEATKAFEEAVRKHDLKCVIVLALQDECGYWSTGNAPNYEEGRRFLGRFLRSPTSPTSLVQLDFTPSGEA